MSRRIKKAKLEYTSNILPRTRARSRSTGSDHKQQSQAPQTIQPILGDQNNLETGEDIYLQQSQADQAFNSSFISDTITPLNSNTQDENVCREASSASHSSLEILPANFAPFLPEISESVMNVCQMVNSQPHSSVEISPANTFSLLPDISESVMNACLEENPSSCSSVEISPDNSASLQSNTVESVTSLNQEEDSQYNSAIEIPSVNNMALPPAISDIESNEANSRSQVSTEISPPNYEPLLLKTSESESNTNVCQQENLQHDSSEEISAVNSVPILPETSESVKSICQHENSQQNSSDEISLVNSVPILPETSESATNIINMENSQHNSSDEISSVNSAPILPETSESVTNKCQQRNAPLLPNSLKSEMSLYQEPIPQSQGFVEISPDNSIPLFLKVSESVIKVPQMANSLQQNEISSANYVALLKKTSESIMNAYQEANSQPSNSIGISPEKSLPLLPQTSGLIMNVRQETNSQSQSIVESHPADYPKTSDSTVKICQETDLNSYCSGERSTFNNVITLPENSESVFVPQELPTKGETPRCINSLDVRDSNIKTSSASIMCKGPFEQSQFSDEENRHLETQGSQKKNTFNKPIGKRLRRKKLIINWRFPLPERLISWFLSKEQREEILKRQNLRSERSS